MSLQLMKVLLLSNSNSEHTQKWAIKLSKKGIEVGVFSLKKCESNIFNDYPSIQLFEPAIQKGHTTLLNKLNYFTQILRLKKTIRSFRPDILHAHYLSSYGLFGAVFGSKNLIVSAWGSDITEFPKKNFLFQLIIRAVLSRAEIITATSTDLIKETKLYTNKKIEHVPFGIDTCIFKNRKLIQNKEIVFCSTKHLEPIYNIDKIILSFYKVNSVYPNSRLVIIGDGSSKKDLKDLSESLPCNKKIEFTGKVKNDLIPDYLNRADVLINIPDNESFGVSVIEAMSCEKGIIVSNVNSLKALISDNINGFCVDQNDLNKITKSMLKYCMNRELIELHGKKSRALTVKEFEFEQCLEKMLRCYESICCMPETNLANAVVN